MSFLALLPVVGKVIDRIFPDPAQKAEANLALMKLTQESDLAELDSATKTALGQMDVNKQEAQHSSIFVAGWRPFVGWVCGAALAYSFILLPVMKWGAFLAGVDVKEAPELDMASLITILGGMLGLGVLRTKEKMDGVAQQMLKPQT